MAEPANNAAYVANRLDTLAQRRFAFPGQQLATELVSRNLNIGFFQHPREDIPTVLWIQAAGRCMAQRWQEATCATIITALEMVAPNLPEACFSNQEISRVNFIIYTMTYLTSKAGAPSLCKTFDHSKLGPFTAPAQEVIGERVRTAPSLGDDARAFINIALGRAAETNIQPGDYTADLANVVAYLAALAFVDPKDKAISLGTAVYTMTYVALAKRGNITDNKLERVVAEVCAETNMRFDLTTEDITTLSKIMEPMVTEENAAVIMRGLSDSMAQFSLRLRIMIDQSARGGMTAYWTIRQAMVSFPTFDWWMLSRYLNDDFANFAHAVELVGDNEYYGFKSNLGRASHTNYKSLAWVAVQLLIMHKGAEYGSLKNYRGLTKQPDHKDRLTQMIESYVPPIGETEFAGIDLLLQTIIGEDVQRPAPQNQHYQGPRPPPPGPAAQPQGPAPQQQPHNQMGQNLGGQQFPAGGYNPLNPQMR